MFPTPFFRSLITWLGSPFNANRPTSHRTDEPRQQASPPPESHERRIAWGARVTPDFKRTVIEIAGRLAIDPNHLMAIIAFETGRSFDPATVNRAGSGATGLIQFMPATARDLGTTTATLARMSAIEQLAYVEKYLRPYAGRMTDLPSAYMAVLYPRAVSKSPDHVLFRKGSVAYKLNRGLDANGNGQVTKAEAAARVEAVLREGLRPGLIG